MNTTIPVLRLDGVTRQYADGSDTTVALAGIDLTVAAGEFVAVMGPSGSGKSTLLNLAAGLDRPTSGHVLVDGDDLAKLHPSDLATVRRRKVGIVFQRLNLVPALTAIENVMLPLELDDARPAEARAAAADALADAGFSGSPNRFPDDLSGGEQQRVAIARAIVGRRQLVLADEPTGALDTVTGDRVVQLLATLVARGAAVVLVTHEPRFASYADRIVFLRDGAIVDESVPEQAGASK